MPSFFEEISEVCIYLQKEDSLAERVNEVALYYPLIKKTPFQEAEKIQSRKKNFARELSLSTKAVLKARSLFFKTFPFLIQKKRKNPETKFKTILALLLSQEVLCDYFLREKKNRDHFFQTIQDAAQNRGYSFTMPPETFTVSQMARYLTTLSDQTISLLDNMQEFNLQLSTINRKERDEILFSILNNIKRLPLTSVLEVALKSTSKKIFITTKYGKYAIKNIDSEGRIFFERKENESKTSLAVIDNFRQSGPINQHKVFDTSEEPLLIGSVSGALKTKHHILEQILFLEDAALNASLHVNKEHSEEKIFLFTSLFSWNEYAKIQDEHNAIAELDGKVLTLNGKKNIRLKLIHQNISFNAFNRFPEPAEIKASINDLNEEGLLFLTSLTLKRLNLFLPQLFSLSSFPDEEEDYLKRQHLLLKKVDQFRSLHKPILCLLDEFLVKTQHQSSDRILALSLKCLISKKLPNGKTWQEIDHYIYLSLLARYLNINHNKNDEHATDRSAGAISIDKAQNAFLKVVGKPYLPGFGSQQENILFRVFYSIYLVFEEPDLNAGLCTGFVGEKFYNNFIQKNPETTHYLTPWLQSHPELYLGLSKYRF